MKTTAEYHANTPLEFLKKQPLAMSGILFSDRPLSKLCGRSR
jgi:hypothetical protein